MDVKVSKTWPSKVKPEKTFRIIFGLPSVVSERQIRERRIPGTQEWIIISHRRSEGLQIEWRSRRRRHRGGGKPTVMRISSVDKLAFRSVRTFSEFCEMSAQHCLVMRISLKGTISENLKLSLTWMGGLSSCTPWAYLQYSPYWHVWLSLHSWQSAVL